VVHDKKTALHQDYSSLTSVYSITAVIMEQLVIENEWTDGQLLNVTPVL
jgi:hypothetical protein